MQRGNFALEFHTDLDIAKGQLLDRFVALVHKASLEHFMARDLMRAAEYDFSAPHDTEQRKKIKRGQKLAPLLIVRDIQQRRLIIADGYHRLGAACEIDDTAEVPCKIISIEGRRA